MMSVERELNDLAEVVRDQVAQGIARDLAFKLLAGVVSQMIDSDHYDEIVQGHLKAIQQLEESDGTSDSEMNEKIAAHFHDLLVEPPEGGAN